ncbi:MAG: GNAT family N-acetyltransferase [Sporolactobacillus sp.]
MMDVPVIESKRLILRPLSVDDAEEVYGWAGDERVTKYVSYSTHADIASVRRWLEGLETNGETYTFGFMLKTTHMLIGCGDIGYSAEEDAWDFGYNFRADCWGKGYATEAARRMIRFAFEQKGARDFIANHAVDNPASGHVIQKCGLIFYKFGELSKFDQSQTFKAKYYRAHFDSLPVYSLK